MKNQGAKRRVPQYRKDTMLCFYKYPEVDLRQKGPDAAYIDAFYAPGMDAAGGYAQNTTAWD